jgi:hypothetical protein
LWRIAGICRIPNASTFHRPTNNIRDYFRLILLYAEFSHPKPEVSNEDQKDASQGIFLIGEKKNTRKQILANAKKPSAATEKIP